MSGERERLRTLPGALIIIAVAVVVTWLAASVALSRLRSGVLPTALASSLKADYGTDGTGTLSPIDSAIAESVARDDRATELGASDLVFAPIFLEGEGNQEPVRLPSGEVQPAPTPTSAYQTLTPEPTQAGGQSTAEPQPTQSDEATAGPLPTGTRQPTATPQPEPTRPGEPTPTPNVEPTPIDEPTATPRPHPTQPEHPTPEPKPTKTPRPTDTPKPKPTHANNPSDSP